MRNLVLFAVIAATLAASLSVARAADSASVTIAAMSETTALLAKPQPKRDLLDGFVMPKYLAIQQENDAYDVAYEAMFHINRTP